MSPRHDTQPGEDRCDGCVRLSEKYNTQREQLIAVLGVDMRSGTLWKTLNDHVEAYKARGARMGDIEKDLAALKEMKTRIQMLSVVGMLGLAAVIKALADWFFK